MYRHPLTDYGTTRLLALYSGSPYNTTMDLYTSLAHLKRMLNDGTLPPMTPLPSAVKDVIDPKLTIDGDGWGGIVEDERGLLCPVRGCGEWHHNLTIHANQKHDAIGGATGFRALMGIPGSAPLVSTAQKTPVQAQAKPAPRKATSKQRPRGQMRKRVPKVGVLNLRDDCPAQLRVKFANLEARLGRRPILREFNAEYGKDFEKAFLSAFGGWDSAIAQCRNRTKRTPFDVDEAFDVLRGWYRIHGDLPTEQDVDRGDKLPLMPEKKVILLAMRCGLWGEAMRRAASVLNIYGGRYGLPESARPRKAIS